MPPAPPHPVTISTAPARITLALTAVVAALAAAHAAVHLALPRQGVAAERLGGIKRFFDMGAEANLPTYAAALVLLLAAALLALVARVESARRGRIHWHWWGLAAGVALMSMDEAAMIHEGLVGAALTQHFGRGEGVMYYNWYKLYIPLVVLIALVYVPFLLRLPLRYSGRLLLAGAVFLGGALGLETLEAFVMSRGLRGISVIRLFEETAEMMGVVLAIHALLLYLADHGVSLRLELTGHAPPAPRPDDARP